ncbi:MAG: anaerobic ribonucleoside-triphosphate reductase activating protein [Oscillospiraceae bacterium]|nr:anaerobic ribonucleoside-triphosphate reductase activating protein [Oscillospiraceae bacterium]
MKIVGIQKLTLLDYPGKVACTVFLNGCNFRCPYCHNAELLGDGDEVMTVAGLLAFLRKRQGILEGVCITGGEPTLHPELPALLRAVRELGYAVKLDTNGYRPEILEAVLSQGLVDYVAMDLKNGPEGYAETVGLAQVELAKICQSIRLLMDSSVDFELRTTVVKPLHSGETVTSMAKWLLETTNGKPIPRLFVQPFVDRDTVPVGGFSAPTGAELEQFCRILGPCAERVELRGT